MHLNIAALSDGRADLVFTHMDGFINASRLPELQQRNASASPAGGLELNGQPVEPACLPLEALTKCSGDASKANLTCGGRRWGSASA